MYIAGLLLPSPVSRHVRYRFFFSNFKTPDNCCFSKKNYHLQFNIYLKIILFLNVIIYDPVQTTIKHFCFEMKISEN